MKQPRNGDVYTDRLYGNTGTPITMDMGGFEISYREPICGGNRVSFFKTRTMLQAVAEFNTLERTSGFDTPMSIKRIGINGEMTDRWTMQGRYDVPQHVTEVRNGHYSAPKARRKARRWVA
jgi:hypothetical protein